MKSTGILNGEISKIVALLGHGDKIAIADSGLPVPSHVKLIDVAIKPGVPDFITVLDTIIQELYIEDCLVAEELEASNPVYLEKVQQIVKRKAKKVTHNKFKEETMNVKAIIRTGEFTPFSNIILTAGVPF